MSAWRVILVAFILYAAGVLTGIFVGMGREDRTRHSGGRPSRPSMADVQERMETRLGLDPKQKEEVRQVLHDHWESVRVEFRRRHEELTTRLEAVLSEEQMVAFRKSFRRQRRDHPRNGRRPPDRERHPEPGGEGNSGPSPPPSRDE